MKKNKKDPYYMYLGNLFVVEDGIGKISDIKYVVIKQKSHLLARPKYIACPGELEVLVGSYAVTAEDEGIPFLINSVRLSSLIGYKKIDSKQVCDIVIQNNDPTKLKKLVMSQN